MAAPIPTMAPIITPVAATGHADAMLDMVASIFIPLLATLTLLNVISAADIPVSPPAITWGFFANHFPISTIGPKKFSNSFPNCFMILLAVGMFSSKLSVKLVTHDMTYCVAFRISPENPS